MKIESNFGKSFVQMKQITLSLIFLTASAAAGIGQTVRPTPTPTPRDDGEVVKITTNLIQVDASVTDSNGDPVTGLTANDFEIYENGQKQKITTFSFVSGAAPPPSKAVAAANASDVPIPPAKVRPEQVRRTIALVVDDLMLSFQSAYYTRRALKKFVDDQMQDGDLVAIIRTGAGIGALQQFTSDKRLLYAAIEKVKWNPLGRAGTGAFAPIEPTPLELAKSIGDKNVSEEDLKEERDFLNSVDDFRSSQFATGTLGALRFIVKGMGELPGRKSVILFSDGFNLFSRDEHGFSDGGRVLEYLRQIVDLANRSSVVFYAIDGRGLQYTGPTAADDIRDPSPAAISAIYSDRSSELFDTQSGLVYLAKETGGFAFLNNNDLSGGVERVLNDQSYYLLGYEPDSDTFDPKTRRYNKFEIKVNQPGVSVRYRSGFFNVATGDVPRPSARLTPLQEITSALTSPFSLNEISLSLNSLFGSEPATGLFVRSLLHIDGKDLKFIDAPGGRKRAEIAILAASFGDNGVPVEQLGRNYTITVNGSGYQKIVESGFVYQFTFPVKKPGAYQYRVALRDTNGGKVGSASQFIEIPDLKKGLPTVSGIVLESFTEEQWKKASEANAALTADLTTDPMTDTSRRIFKQGSVLRYGFEIYNARLGPEKKPDLTIKIRVFRDDKLILDGQPTPFELLGQADMATLKSAGAISLSKGMPAGDYVMQVIVTDNLARSRKRIATQFVQFEVTGP